MHNVLLCVVSNLVGERISFTAFSERVLQFEGPCSYPILRKIMKAQFQFVWIPIFLGMNVLIVLSCICSVTFTASMACSKNWYWGLVGEEIQFHCNITDVPKASWQRNMIPLFVRYIDLIQTDNIYVFNHNYSLIVDSIRLKDEGFYECIEDDKVASTYCLYVTLPPRVLLSHNGSTLINATYDKEYTNQMYVGETTYVEEGTQVNVNCFAEGAKPEAILTWTKNENPIDTIVNTTTTRNLIENRTFDTTSSLQFVANEENIIITCNSSLNGTDIETLVSATFLTYVKPTVFFLVNGKKVASSDYVPENENVNITCYAKGARPAANLTLEGDNSHNLRMESHANRNSSKDSTTFDTNSTFTIQAKDEKQTFSCTSTILEIDHAETLETISLELNTFVLPKPVITVNGKRSDDFSFDPGDEVAIVCNASAARPKPRLTLTRNGEPFHDTNSASSGSPGVIFSFNFLPKDGDVVMCLSFLDKVNTTEMVNVTFYDNETSKNDTLELELKLILPSTAVVFIVLLLLIIYISTRRRRGSKSTDLSALQLALRDRPLNGVNNVSRDLPAIRQSISTDEVVAEIYCDEGKTSMVTDVQMVIQLPGEGTFQYWTANASFENESSKKIIVKCLSESVQLKEHFNFRSLADNLKTLKKHRNVIDILGVSITNVPYYIYLEYLEYGTLRDFLLRNYQQSRDSQCNITQTLDERAIQLTGFALDVADGLIYLTDRDYCHPALCTRKVLLTKMGTCKLYDFWPKTLSTERINQILQKSLPPVAWLSPETIFLSHYFDKSDVWTYGVTLWEIYSLGETPYGGLTCEEIEQEIRKMHYLDQPLTCPGGLFSMMLASWDKTVDKRPDLSEWKQKLVCLLQSAKEHFGDENKEENGDRNYFTLEDNVCDYEDDYIEQ